MSVILSEDMKKYKCRCGRIIRLLEQETKDYGLNTFLEFNDGCDLEEVIDEE